MSDFCLVIGPNILGNLKNVISYGMQFSEMKYYFKINCLCIKIKNI